MNSTTIDRLNRLNREFYSRRAGEFDRARELPWQGWKRVVEGVRPAAARGRLALLDVGCGNGRFASYLHESVAGFDYLGVDSSRELLDLARARLATLPSVKGELIEIDLTRAGLAERVGERRFGLVVAFGLLHHVPGLELRQRILSDLVATTGPDGLLAIAFWQFAEYDRFRRRFVDWESFNRAHADDPVDLAQLEVGDHLLAWGDDRSAVRYCHWSGPDEIRSMVATAGVDSFELYSGRGGDRFNLYALIR